jgi:hypothetical protein
MEREDIISELHKMFNSAEHCFICGDDSGCYATVDMDGDPEPNQCEFCYVNPISKFNLRTKIADYIIAEIEKAKKDATIETLNTILSAFKSNDLAYGKLPCEYIEKLLKQAQDK